VEVSLVPKEFVEGCWSQVEGYLEGAAKYTYGRYNVQDIKDCITDYDHQLWIAFENDKIYGAVVTEIANYPRCRILAMQFTGGVELKKWKKPMLEILQRWAKDNGCEKIESPGRPGWARVFRDDGYEAKFITYELPVG
jgi:hypothetical protein